MAQSKDNKFRQIVEAYFVRMREIGSSPSKTSEQSYKGALEDLLQEVGHTGRSKVTCILEPDSRGAGRPDYALFAGTQRRSRNEIKIWKKKEKPEHGVVEAKGHSEDIDATIQSRQTLKYLTEYDLVLVTNFWSFKLVSLDKNGKIMENDNFSITNSESDFWNLIETPKAAAMKYGDDMAAFLQRVMMHRAKLTEPEDVAWLLAYHARAAKKMLENSSQTDLALFKEGMEGVLRIEFDSKKFKTENFFNSTVVQTLMYGIFSAWVNWSKEGKRKKEKFEWDRAAKDIQVQAIKILFEEVARDSNIEALGLREILDQITIMLNQIDRKKFFKKFSSLDAIEHFYEPFLKAFDPIIREDLGVWYTPKEIVNYMVERVDRTLRLELGFERGLADKNVYVLDPCCGTGTYIMAVLERIKKTLEDEVGDSLVGEDLKEAVQERIFGFEIIPAPLVIAHWQVENFLASEDFPLDHSIGERAPIYLTNAFTGGLVSSDKNEMKYFPGLAIERDHAERVKNEEEIVVVLGNPPYNAFAGSKSVEEENLADIYDGNDLYAKFIRVAETRIAKTGKGIVSYITNASWISEESYEGLRKHLLYSFDKFWIENMHGDRNAGEKAPDGRSSESVFKTKISSGIRQKVSIFLGVKRGGGRASTERSWPLFCIETLLMPRIPVDVERI